VTDTEDVQATASEFYVGLASEFLHHYRRGPRFVAVTGVPESGPARVADLFSAALRDAGQHTHRVSLPEVSDPDVFRDTTVAPFRSCDGVLVVDGSDLLSPDLRGFWNFSIWVEHDPERSPGWSFVTTEDKDRLGSPREAASVLMDDADPAHPQRLWADFC